MLLSYFGDLTETSYFGELTVCGCAMRRQPRERRSDPPVEAALGVLSRIADTLAGIAKARTEAKGKRRSSRAWRQASVAKRHADAIHRVHSVLLSAAQAGLQRASRGGRRNPKAVHMRTLPPAMVEGMRKACKTCAWRLSKPHETETQPGGPALCKGAAALYHSINKADGAVPAVLGYEQSGPQAEARSIGELEARFQATGAGRLTTPHIDVCKKGRKVRTTIALTDGEQLVWTWSDEEKGALEPMPEMTAGAAIKWVEKLSQYTSLRVWHATPGVALTMPPGMVHMVLTVAAKEQLTWHEFM